MSPPLLHPGLEAVLAIHAATFDEQDGSLGVRSRALLESALAAAQSVPPADPIEIAAAYLFFLGRNDPFLYGSRQVALGTCLVFLNENGLLKNEELDASAWESLTCEAAAGMLSREEVTQKLRELVS